MRAHRWVLPTVVLTCAASLLPVGGPVAAATPRCQGRPATIVGTSHDDRLTGTRKADVIVGRGGDDRIDGAGRGDLICGGPGADRIDGGSGADRLYGDKDQLRDGPAGRYLVGDVLEGGPGNDLLAGGTDRRDADHSRRPDTFSWAGARRAVTVDLSGSGTTGSATGEGIDTVVLGPGQGIVGSPYADRITGSRKRDRISGGAGADQIRSGRGADLVYPDGFRRGRPGNDVVETGPGKDLVSSLSGRDRISTRGGADFVEAFSAEPTVVDVGAGNDYLGQDVVRGAGARAEGGTGNDVVSFYGSRLGGQEPQATFVLDYRSGTTRATGSVTAKGTIGGFEGHRFIGPLGWSFFGASGPDRVWAIDGGPLRARAYAGNDQITGTDGDDLIDGGPGTDSGWGEGGRDDCRSIERGDC